MENWKFIDGIEVSNYGGCRYDGKITTDNNGYLKISKEDKYIHILVAKGFCNWFEGCVVHHKNENKNDNRAENLICLTPSEHSKIHSKNNRNGKHILQYSLDGEFIAEYKSIREASIKTGISIEYISKFCKNKSIVRTYKGKSYVYNASDCCGYIFTFK